MPKDVQLEAISVVAELDRIGWDWESVGDDEIRVRCPAHADEHPSCGISLTKRFFKCHVPACGAHGDFVTFMGLALKEPSRRVIIEDLARRYPFTVDDTVPSETVERWHDAIWAAGPMLHELRLRGVTDDAIRRHRLGFDGRRVTIPVKNEHGRYVNVRKYMPGAPGPEKMRNTRGHGGIRLFPVDQLKYDTVVIVGGEIKAVVTAEKMNPHGVGALCATAGEGNWEPEFSRLLRGKRVFVSFDVDDEGATAAQLVAARNRGDARWVGVVVLDLDRDKHPHGDQNDYFGAEGRTAEDYLALLARTPEWEPPKPVEEQGPTEATPVSLSAITRAENAGRRVATAGVVTAIAETPYLVPGKVSCECHRNQDFCGICPVYARTPDEETGSVTLAVSPESPGVLGMVDANRKRLRDATREALRIPPCNDVQFRTVEHYAVEDVRLTPPVSLSCEPGDSSLRPAYFVGHGLESNAAYVFEGRVYPHPEDQRAVLLASAAKPAVDSLASYAPTGTELEELHLFKPTRWTVEAVQEKLDDLYADVEANVTRIFQRRPLHLATDLAYHSVLTLPFDGRQVKGWVEVLILGDSGQGKTETTEGLMRHYGLGERVVCKNTSVAGLMGGLEQIGGRWFVRWGVFPTHDRRLLIMEEAKGASQEVLGKLTDMRSSGVAEVNKIEKRRASARVRLVMVSNPRRQRPLAEYSFGVEAVTELMGSLEDVRRFDLAYLVSSRQVNEAAINVVSRERPRVVHRHVSALCQRLVLWAWTRRPEQVQFTAEATDATMEEATRLSGEFDDSLPLVDRAGVRYKVARLAAALAARTFSSANSDPQVLVVRPCHVEHVAAFLRSIYSDSAAGYVDYSQAVALSEKLVDPDGLKARIFQVPYLKDFVSQVLATNEIELRDLCDWCGWDGEDGRQFLSLLVRKHAIVRDGHGYRKTAPFIAMLKQLRDSPELEKNSRPEWVKDADLGGTRDM